MKHRIASTYRETTTAASENSGTTKMPYQAERLSSDSSVDLSSSSGYDHYDSDFSESSSALDESMADETHHDESCRESKTTLRSESSLKPSSSTMALVLERAAANLKRYQMSLQSPSPRPTKRQRPAAEAYTGVNNSSAQPVSGTCRATNQRLRQSAPALVGMRTKQQMERRRSSVSSVEVKDPKSVLRDLLSSVNMTAVTRPSLELDDFFFNPSQESIDGYDMEIAMAVRRNDVATLQRLHDAGRNLQVGNSFGESVVHTACRRGSEEVLAFLIRTAKINVRVRCDYGRTPLHDACWSAEPNLSIVNMLLDACPDFLYITDKRGFTPLEYVHQKNWAAWCTFLEERGTEGLLPAEICLPLQSK